MEWCGLHCLKLPCPVCADRAVIRRLWLSSVGVYADADDMAVINRAMKEAPDAPRS